MFDFDGVIADSGAIYLDTFMAVCSEMGFDQFNSKEDFLKLFEGNALLRLVKMGFPLRRLRQLAEDFRPRIEEANRRVRPFDGMADVLSELAGLYPVYVITSNVTEHIVSFLEKHAVEGVRGVVGGDQEMSKAKRIRRVRRRHRNRVPYYIGDTKGDMREAHRARVVPIGVAWGWHTVDTLREGRPQHVFDSPEALRAFFVAERQ